MASDLTKATEEDIAHEAWLHWLNNPREHSFYSTEDVFKEGFKAGMVYG